LWWGKFANLNHLRLQIEYPTMTSPNKCSLLEKLISRGDHIEIVDGALSITPTSNKEIPEQWLKDNRETLISEIAQLADVEPYIYLGFSTGSYGDHKAGGVSLQFTNLITGEDAYAVFNAELTRARKSKSGDKGTSLAKGKFRVRKGFEFYRFWLLSGLNIPPRLSVFDQYMGNLKCLVFIPELGNRNKFINKKTKLMNVSYEQVSNSLGYKSTYNRQTTDTQQTYNRHTRMTHSDLAQPYIDRGLQINSSACSNKCGLSLQGSEVLSTPLPVINIHKTPQEQTTEEWLIDLDNA
jgi:hypothetical protein